MNISKVQQADQVNGTVTLTDITDLQMEVVASKKYAFEAFIIYSSSVVTTGIRLDVNGPAIGAGQITWERETLLSAAQGVANKETRVLTAYQSDAPTASVDAANARRTARISGVLENGVNGGTLALQFAAENANNVTVHKGSYLKVATIG